MGASFLEEGSIRSQHDYPLFMFTSLFNSRTAIALCGKLFAAGNFSVVYMYTAEIYPTIIRFSWGYMCDSIFLFYCIDKLPLVPAPA